MRIALLPDEGSIIASDKGLRLRRRGRDQALSIGDFDPYYPLGPLAVAPDGRHAWLRDRGGQALRLDLETGAVERFDFALRDAVYAADGSIIAVLASQTQAGLVRFDDREPMAQRPIPCPSPQRIHWPFAPPYRYASYELEWRGALRLTATRWGVALAHVSGLLWLRFTDGPELAWTMPPVYQGWTCAYIHEGGVVVTNVHNGRTGDIVWLDRQGVWQDCFDSNWVALGPCVPSKRGFVAGLDETLVRFEGYPAQICEQLLVGDRIEDAAVDLDGDRLAVCFGPRLAQTRGDGASVQLWIGDEIDELPPQRVGEPVNETPWAFTPIDDPDLGRLWRPDYARARALADRLRNEAVADPEAALEAEIPGPSLKAPADADLLEQVLLRLRRWIPPELSRAALLRVLGRLAEADPPTDDFLDWSLRSALPPELRDARPQAPVHAWLQAQVPALHEGQCGDRPIRRATLRADVHQRPAWSLIVEIAGEADAGDETWRVRLEDFDPACLTAPPSEVSDAWAVVAGTLFRPDGTTAPVVVTVDPEAGGFAHRVAVSPPRSGEALLRTGAYFEPVPLETVEQARVLTYRAEDWPLLYTGRDPAGRLCASPFADDLVDPQPFPKPPPLPAMRALLEALVADELLELEAAIDDGLLWAVEVAVLGSPPERAGAALEALLLEHPAVDELFADPEQLQARLQS